MPVHPKKNLATNYTSTLDSTKYILKLINYSTLQKYSRYKIKYIIIKMTVQFKIIDRWRIDNGLR